MFYHSFPLQYQEPLFRPPSEADSLILQVTFGCTWNHCAFCEMYQTKAFQVKKEEDVIREIEAIAAFDPGVRKVFLADGNPMALSTHRLLFILKAIKKHLPKVRRVSTYALPRDILAKTTEELIMLKTAGLTLLYVGIESGDDEVLKLINKGETSESTVDGLLKAKAAGMKISAIILNGVGGKQYSHQHAIHSAKVLNAIQPEYTSILVLSFPYGVERYQNRFTGSYIPMTIMDLLIEMQVFIEHTELEASIFRSNHASNYLILSGILSKDKATFIEALDQAIAHPQNAGLRAEWQRGL